MKRSIFVILSLLFVISLYSQTVAVFGFDLDDKNSDKNPTLITDLLLHELVKAGEITVVERAKLDKVVKEFSFQSSAFVDENSAKEMGQWLGADCVIVGSIVGEDGFIYIVARLLDVESGKILHSAKIKLNFWKEYEEKLPIFARECVKKMPTKNYFTGIWTGSVFVDGIEDYYELTFKDKSKCAVKVISTDDDGFQTTREGTGVYSCYRDYISEGLIFKLTASLRDLKYSKIKRINWTYPINFNDEKNSFSLNIRTGSDNKLVRLILSKEE